MPRGEANTSAKITTEIVSGIYAAFMAGDPVRTIAARHNLDKSTLRDIVTGKAWKHCLGINGNPTVAQLLAVPLNKRPGAKVTPELAREIKDRIASGETGRAIAKSVGLHFASVSDIKRGLTWRDA
jgi:hypothetical protein